MVAGHLLGEFSLVANGALSFEDGLKLVKAALAMQKACEIKPSTMAAVGLADNVVEEVVPLIDGIVVTSITIAQTISDFGETTAVGRLYC
jgi:[acyl-carrier-protein] S-malonyltransferase